MHNLTDIFELTQSRYPLMWLRDSKTMKFAIDNQLTDLVNYLWDISCVSCSGHWESFQSNGKVAMLLFMPMTTISKLQTIIENDKKTCRELLSKLPDVSHRARNLLTKALDCLTVIQTQAQLNLSNYTFCSWCKKVYDRAGVVEHPEVSFELGASHGICQSCKIEMGKEISQRKKLKGFEDLEKQTQIDENEEND